jgi:hypothetical protein
MASKSETGHAVNANNFEKLYFKCKVQGGTYNPQDPDISEVSLKNKVNKIKDRRTSYREKAGPWMKVVNDRESDMEPVDGLMTQVKNAADISLGSNQFKIDVAGFVKKIHGERIGAKITVDPNDPTLPTDETVDQISASHVGYDNKVENIGMLVALLTAETGYAPNEDYLKPTALSTLFATLQANNSKVAELTPEMENARNLFKAELYQGGNGAFDLQKEVKKYFKSVFGATSPQYHDVAKLKFVNLM